jgi:RimJ/RimL family protein N-acetyltransferase
MRTRLDRGVRFPWSLWCKQDGAFVGLIELRVRASAADLGYALARRWWRQGLMSEAVTASVLDQRGRFLRSVVVC